MALTFSEEFSRFSYWNGSSGTWDTGYPWTSANGGTNESNGEEQWYVNANYSPTSKLNTYAIENGALNINAAPTPSSLSSAVNGYDYTSGMITTYHSFSQTYGYFEMSAQIPAGKGLWPAFWLLPTDQSWPPEIDVMEVIGSEPNTLNTTVHYGKSQQKGIETDVSGMTTGFHTYGVDWQKDTITWYYDGKKVYEVDTPAGMDKPMYMLANLAVGGSWPGSPNSSTKFPAMMKIDYIRAYDQRPDGSVSIPGTVGSDTGSSQNGTPDKDTTDQQPLNLPTSSAYRHSYTGTSASDTLQGSSSHDKIDGRGGSDVMRGGKGADTYIVDNRADRIIEKAGQGIDTVKTSLSFYKMASQVENLMLTGRGNQSVAGNDLNNLIVSNGKGNNLLKGGAGDDQLVAGRYKDVLVGGSGHDTFVFKSAPSKAGHVLDFQDGVDVLDLRGLFKGYSGKDPVADGHLLFSNDGHGNTQVKFKASDTAKFAMITTLDDVKPSQLHAGSDYFFV